MKELSAVTRFVEEAPPDFRALLEVAGTVAPIATDLSDRIIYFSPGESLGYRAEEVLKGYARDFYRRGFFTATAAGKGMGTGLGLAAVCEMVSKSGGHITVDGEPGSGATFEICLPRVEEAGEQAQERAPARLMRGSETILVAEDEVHLRDLVRQALQRQGYTVLAARDGNEAMRLSERYAGPIHLLLADVVMPGMSGHELAHRLATVRPEIKVVYMSGHTEDAILRHGVPGNRIAFLQKPFTLDSLARKLREVVDGARPNVADSWL